MVTSSCTKAKRWGYRVVNTDARSLATTRCWVMAPAEYSPTGAKGRNFRKCWQYDLEHRVISIGWDLREAPESREHLAGLWKRYAAPEWANSKDGFRMLSQFWFDVEPGDMVIARAGLTQYIGLGQFEGKACYDEGAAGLTWGCSLRRVLWEPAPRVRNSPVRFARKTLYTLKPYKVALFGL